MIQTQSLTLWDSSFMGGQIRQLAVIIQGNRGRKSTKQTPDPAGGLVMVERLISGPMRNE